MARTPKTPQQKKRLALKKDRRNTYGENAKSSRKNIPRSKALSHRAARHGAKAGLTTLADGDDANAETMESTLSQPRLQKGNWRKTADTPLGVVVKRKLARRTADVGARQKRRARQQQHDG